MGLPSYMDEFCEEFDIDPKALEGWLNDSVAFAANEMKKAAVVGKGNGLAGREMFRAIMGDALESVAGCTMAGFEMGLRCALAAQAKREEEGSS